MVGHIFLQNVLHMSRNLEGFRTGAENSIGIIVCLIQGLTLLIAVIATVDQIVLNYRKTKTKMHFSV